MSQLNLQNQFGEVSENTILPSSDPFPPFGEVVAEVVIANILAEPAEPIAVPFADFVAALPLKNLAAGSMLANLTGGAAAPVAITFQNVANILPAKAGVTAIAALATADAPAQGVGYVQADVQAIATLANDLKAKLNAVLAALKVVS